MSAMDRISVEFTSPVRIAWDWNDLLQDATTAGYNINLAVAGLVMSRNAEFTSKMVEETLRQLGFDSIKSDYYLISTRKKDDVSKPARTFGHRLIEKDGKQYHVICAVFKGTTTIEDSITDIKSIEDGFLQGGLSCKNSLSEYLNSFEGLSKENTVMFITGHSLGASTANVVGRLARDLVRDESEFVYAFASPNYETNGEWENGKDYPNFHYFTNKHDIVPDVPLKLPPHFFSKIGTERLYDYETLDDEQMRKFTRVYRYFRGTTFEEDTDLLGLGFKETESMGFKLLKNHLAHTYMSFILSELPDDEIDEYLIKAVVPEDL